MKKLVNVFNKTTLVAGIVGVAVSGAASADFNVSNMKFYAGAGVDYAKVGLSKEAKDGAEFFLAKIKSKGLGVVAPILGVKFNDNFGLEAGYSFNKKLELKVLGRKVADMKVRNAYLDLMGFMPVMDKVELIGGLGIGKLMIKKGKNINTDFSNKFGVRFKFGAQYNFTDHVGVRALATYQTANSKYKKESEKIVKNMTSIGVAATYTF